jgi:phosphohistidine phosphatase
MQAVFIRHGSAEAGGTKPDADRQLTEEGHAEVRATAEALRRMGLRLERVLTSPLARAVRSAGLVSEAHGGAAVEVAEFLAPPADAKALRRRLTELAGADVSAVGLVGHTPSLEACIGELIAGPARPGLSLSKAGAACVELPPAGSADRPELQWLMRREQLAALSATP